VTGNFTAQETRSLERSFAAGEMSPCPRCGNPLDQTPVLPSPEVAYVRNRVLIQCLHCRLKGVLELK